MKTGSAAGVLCASAAIAIALTGGACRVSAENAALRERAHGDIVVRRFRVPTAGARLAGIAIGPDGAIWFAERQGNRIGRLTTTRPYTFDEFPLPHPNSGPFGIAAGPDGNLWFTEAEGERVGSISPRPPHAIVEVDIPATKPWVRSIIAGPASSVWIAEQAALRIGRVTTGATPEIHDFPLPRNPNLAESLAAGPDGNVWFGSRKASIGRVLAIFPESMVEFPFQSGQGVAAVLTAASDGNLWFAREQEGTFGRILAEEPHTITEFRLGVKDRPSAICASSGYVWLALRPRASIFRIELAPPHRVREIPLPPTFGAIGEMTAGADGNIWFTSPGVNSIGELLVGTLARGASGRQDARLSIAATGVAEYVPVPPVEAGTLEILTDTTCTVTIDVGETFRLTANDARNVPIPAGKHQVVGIAAVGGERCEREVEVFGGIIAYAKLERFGENAPAPVAVVGNGRLGTVAPVVPTDPRIAFVSIPAGDFEMGSDVGRPDEKPAHRVRITKPFEIARYELTQKEWSAVMGPIPPYEAKGRPWIRYLDMGDDKPVVGISWEDAREFAQRLTVLDGARRYRMPTEAEWEYVCRSGIGEDIPAGLADFAWIRQEHVLELHKVGQKKPNMWGIYDMHGNAGEWVSDWYDRDYYHRSAATDPQGPPSGYVKLDRGGGANAGAANLGCVYRGSQSLPVGREGFTGLRLVRDVPSSTR